MANETTPRFVVTIKTPDVEIAVNDTPYDHCNDDDRLVACFTGVLQHLGVESSRIDLLVAEIVVRLVPQWDPVGEPLESIRKEIYRACEKLVKRYGDMDRQFREGKPANPRDAAQP